MELVFSMMLISTVVGIQDEVCLPNRTESCPESDPVSLDLRYYYSLMVLEHHKTIIRTSYES